MANTKLDISKQFLMYEKLSTSEDCTITFRRMIYYLGGVVESLVERIEALEQKMNLDGGTK